MNWSVALASLILASVTWTIISIIRNYSIARKIGLPIIVSPVSPLNPLWILTSRAFPSILLLRYLPFGFGKWARCTVLGWTFKDKHALHDELGSVFVIVTPGGNEVTVADAEITYNLLSRRKDFIKPAVMYEQLNVFGRNLNSVEGKDWERHRRLTAPNFNERTSSMVWAESLRQATDMAHSWAEEGAEGTKETVADTATLALHVLTSVGFGLAYPFHGGVRDLPEGHSMSYRDALSLCVRNIITFAILPKKVLSSSYLPKSLQELGRATKDFQKYMEEMLAHERSVAATHQHGPENLMGSLVRASEEASKTADANDPAHLGLTGEEIFGNIFTFNLAGHETTANTLGTSIVLLAAKPRYQDWLFEEMHEVFGTSTSPGDWQYERTFPKLQRCLAVMYETLRLYGSIVFIPKSTGLNTQTLTIGDKIHVVPPNTAINVNVQALHTDVQIWGHDALEWRPNRWLKPSPLNSSGNDESLTKAAETFIEPGTGTFVPWADGPRACVGRKFSQVEFVATLATLFARYRVRPVPQGGESEEQARRVLVDMAEGSAISAITLQMQEPKKRGLRWEEQQQGKS